MSEFRLIRTAKPRTHSAYSPGGAEWPDYYITLQKKNENGDGWEDVPIVEEHEISD